MKVENAEMLVPVRPVRPGGVEKPTAAGASQTGGGGLSGAVEHAAVHAAAEAREANVQRERRPPEPPPTSQEQASEGRSKDESLRARAKLTQLWSEFREAGIVPPPQSYAGLKVLTPASLLESGSGDASGGMGISARDEMQLLLIRNLLRRMEQMPPPDPGGNGADETPR